jgi:uncharacterized metal-binding protein
VTKIAEKLYVTNVQKVGKGKDKRKEVEVMRLPEEEAERKAELLNEINTFLGLEVLITGADYLLFPDTTNAITIGNKINELRNEYNTIKGNKERYFVSKKAKYSEGDILDSIPQNCIEDKVKEY